MRGPGGRICQSYGPDDDLPEGMDWEVVKIECPAGVFFIAQDQATADEWSCAPGAEGTVKGRAAFSRLEMVVILEKAQVMSRKNRQALMREMIAGKLAMPKSFRVENLTVNEDGQESEGTTWKPVKPKPRKDDDEPLLFPREKRSRLVRDERQGSLLA